MRRYSGGMSTAEIASKKAILTLPQLQAELADKLLDSRVALRVVGRNRHSKRSDFANLSFPAGQRAREGREPTVLNHFDRGRLGACALAGAHLLLAF